MSKFDEEIEKLWFKCDAGYLDLLIEAHDFDMKVLEDSIPKESEPFIKGIHWFCGSCNSIINEGSFYCSHCGSKLNWTNNYIK